MAISTDDVTSSVVQVSGLASFIFIPETEVVEVHPVASPAADFMNCLSSLSLSLAAHKDPRKSAPVPGVPGTAGPRHGADICVSSSPVVSRMLMSSFR